MSQDKFSLDQHEKNDPFRTPDNYFSQLPEAVMHKVRQEANEEIYHKSSLRQEPVFWAAAASVILLITLVFWFQPDKPAKGVNTDYEAILAEVPEAEMASFLAEEPIDVLNYVELSRSEEELILEPNLEAAEIPEDYSANWGAITDYL